MIPRLETFDDVVSLQRGEYQVDEPQREHEAGCDDLHLLVSSQLSSDGLRSPDHQYDDDNHRLSAENRHGEGEAGNKSQIYNCIPSQIILLQVFDLPSH